MIPDYLTFIRFQDKRNLIYIYAIGLILIGFYWKNAGFTFPSEDIGVVSGILALVLYNFIFDLKAYWAYKCVTKNIDFSWFKKK
ncbi:putative membrane protein [Escherichia coli DEC14B]|nr:putative membrane protein [Escherichia coli DEC14B]